MAGRVLYGIDENFNSGVQFGTGMLIANFEYQDIETVEELDVAINEAVTNKQSLGATEGGVKVRVGITYGRPTVDGLGSFPFKGGLLPESVEAYLTANVKTFSLSNLSYVYSTARFAMSNATDAAAVSMRINMAVSDEDYLDNLCWIGSVEGGQGYVLIALFNAFCQQTGEISSVDGIAGSNLPLRADANLANFSETQFVPAEIKKYFSSTVKASDEFDALPEGKVVLAPVNP